MNLTEPHCGTDLGLLKTRAEPNRRRQLCDHRHQDLHLVGRARPSENIIHLVLAKIAGAPDNVKGISLFVVPKFLVNDDGSLGERNRRQLRRDRKEDGHPRQRDLRDEL